MPWSTTFAKELVHSPLGGHPDSPLSGHHVPCEETKPEQNKLLYLNWMPPESALLIEVLAKLSGSLGTIVAETHCPILISFFLLCLCESLTHTVCIH